MAGEISNLFAFDFFRHSNFRKRVWTATRVDLQLTLGYDFQNKDHIDD